MNLRSLTLLAALIGPPAAVAQVTMVPHPTFGGGDGWFAPGEGGYTFLGTANNERGLAFGNNHLYLVSRAGGVNVRILDKSSGADVGVLNAAGVTGGTFAANVAGVGGDGAIYVSNLTTNVTSSAYKVYRWSDETSAATTAINSTTVLAGARMGDSLAVTGSGASTRLAAGFSNSPSVAGNNGYAVLDPNTAAETAVGFTGTPPNAGDFRLGITFSGPNQVIGTQGAALRVTDFAGSAGTLLGSPVVAGSDRLISFATVGGMPLLAVQNTVSSLVSIYDMTDPVNPLLLTSGNATSGTLTANGNGSGQLAWDLTGGGDTATLYAMSTNQGIQAFVVTVPEPTSLGLVGLAVGGWAARRWRRK